MTNNTLANSHLSKYGRFGDTEMYKTSPSGPGKGEEWHVSDKEKEYLKKQNQRGSMYGLEGEKLVDAVGSGTINPYTGKEEKFVLTTAIALGSLALSGYQSWKSGSIQEQTSKSKVSASEEGIAATEKAEKALEESFSARRDVFEQEFGKANQDLGRETGYAFEQSREQYETLAAGTGLRTSGVVVQSEEKSRERIGAEKKSKTEDLIAQLGRSMGSLMEEYGTEKGRLKSEREKFERELNLSQEQSQSWYLGKYAGKAGGGLAQMAYKQFKGN
jgi:hypothetical protein